jgi:hypothetical protein
MKNRYSEVLEYYFFFEIISSAFILVISIRNSAGDGESNTVSAVRNQIDMKSFNIHINVVAYYYSSTYRLTRLFLLNFLAYRLPLGATCLHNFVSSRGSTKSDDKTCKYVALSDEDELES